MSRLAQHLLTLCLLIVGQAFGGTPRFAFVPNIDDGTVSQFYVNAATGQLFPNGYVVAGDHPRSFVAVGTHAYVANMNSGDITAFTLNQATGQLTPLPSPTYSAPGQPYALVAHPNGKFLYVVNSLGGNVYAYAINSDGSLSMIQTVAAGTNPRFLAVHGTGKFLFVSNLGSNNVSAYKVNATTGLLTKNGTYSTGGTSPSNIMSSGTFLYVTNAKSNNVSAYVINLTTGVLAHVAGSPFKAGTSPYSLSREYNGNFIYVGNSLSNNISAYKVNQASGALTQIAGSPFPATKGTQALRVDPSDRFLYAADAGAEEVMVYALNATTGALSNTSSIRTHGIGFDVYVSNGAANVIAPAIAYVLNLDDTIPFNVFPLATYRINATNGALTAIASTIDTGDIDSVSADATGRLLYQHNAGWHDIPGTSVCRVNPNNGACTGGGFSNTNYTNGADDPQGKYHYFGFDDPNTGEVQLTGYRFAPAGLPFTMTQLSTSPFPSYFGLPLGFDLSGKFMYTLSGTSNSIFRVNAGTGDLTYSTTNFDGFYSSLLHPNGRFLYTPVSGGVLAEAINPGDGNLTTLSFSTAPGSPLIEQTGNFAYISNGTVVNLYRVNRATGALTKITTVLTSHARVSMDASGNFLYLLLNGVMGSTPTLITSYKINHSTGALTLGSTLSFPTESSSGYSMTTIKSVQ